MATLFLLDGNMLTSYQNIIPKRTRDVILPARQTSEHENFSLFWMLLVNF
jgi:hypothetical protein